MKIDRHPKTISFLTGFVLGIFSVILMGLSIFVVPDLRNHVKELARNFLKDHHPIGSFRKIVAEAKNDVKSRPGATVIPSKFLDFPFPGNRAESSNGILSWIAPFSMRIRPDDRPPRSEIGKPGTSKALRLVGLKGETLSFQIVLRANQSKKVHVVLALDPSEMGSSCLVVHRFLEWYITFMDRATKDGPLRTITNPDPLIPFHDPYGTGATLVSKVSVKDDSNQVVWIDVKMSRNCQAGNHHGTLTLSTKRHIIRKTSVVFEVLNAVLPRTTSLQRWMELYNTRFWRGEMIKNDDEYRRLYQRYFLVGQEYGFDTNTSNLLDIRWDGTGTPTSVNWDNYDRTFGPILSGQLTGSPPHAWCLPIPTYSLGGSNWGGFTIYGQSPSPIQNWTGIPDIATRNLAKVIVQHWKEKGWNLKNAFAYIWDEPEHQLVYYPDTYKLIANEAISLHKGSKELNVMITDTPYITYKNQVGHHKSVMSGLIDIWAPNSEYYVPDRFEKERKRGARTWFYQNGPPFIGRSNLDTRGPGFRMWFWAAWKYKVDGVFYWASTFWNGSTEGNNPYHNPGIGDGIVFYPGKQLHLIGYPDIEGPVPSIRMAQWRRGYEDYKYFVLLERYNKKSIVEQTVDSLVQKALNPNGYTPAWRDPDWQRPGDWSHDPQAWHRTRVQLARKISSLVGKTKN